MATIATMPARSDEARLSAVPPVPRTIEATGMPVDQVEQLLLKTMYGAEVTGMTLAERMRIPYSLMEPLIERARAQLLVEVRGASGSGTAGYRYALTDLDVNALSSFCRSVSTSVRCLCR